MRYHIAVSLVAGLSFATGFAQSPPERKLQITFQGSDMTLIAQNVTIAEILREWARLSGSIFVNAERVPGGPITVPMQFEKQPQTVVLKSLLRQAGGYIAFPRREGRPGASDFEVVYILPTSTPTSSGYAGMNSPVQAPLSSVDDVPPIPPIANAPPAAEPPSANRPAQPGVYVPIQAVPPPTTTTGRGRGGF